MCNGRPYIISSLPSIELYKRIWLCWFNLQSIMRWACDGKLGVWKFRKALLWFENGKKGKIHSKNYERPGPGRVLEYSKSICVKYFCFPDGDQLFATLPFQSPPPRSKLENFSFCHRKSDSIPLPAASRRYVCLFCFIAKWRLFCLNRDLVIEFGEFAAQK